MSATSMAPALPAPAPVPAPAPAPGVTLPGIDVSGIGQGANFNWSAYRGHIAFAFIKATQGNTFRDPDYVRNWQQAAAVGVIRGAYHFLDPALSGADQARFFLAVAQPAPGDLIMLDHETLPVGMSPATAAACAVDFCDAARLLTGAWPIVYTDQDMATNGSCAGLGQCPAFIADPSHVSLADPLGPWSLISFTQDGQRGVDTDTFYGAKPQLQRLAVIHRAGPPPPPKPAILTTYRLEWAPPAAPVLIPQHSTDGGRTWS